MKPLAIIVLCLLIVVVSTAISFLAAIRTYGLPMPGDTFWWQYVLLPHLLPIGGIGVTIAICIAAGLHLIRKVQARLLTKGLAVVFALFWSAVGALLPPLIMVASGLFGGEQAMGLFLVTAVTIGMGSIAFVTFAVVITCLRQV